MTSEIVLKAILKKEKAMLNILVKASITATMLISVTMNTSANEIDSLDNSTSIKAPAKSYLFDKHAETTLIDSNYFSQIDSIGCYDYPLCEFGGD